MIKILIKAPNNEDLVKEFPYSIDFKLANLEYYEKEASKGDEFAKFAIERSFYKAVRELKSKIQPQFDYYFFSPYINLGKLYTEVIYFNLKRFFEDYSNVHIDLKEANYYSKWWGFVNQLKQVEVIQYDKHRVNSIKKSKLPLLELGISSNTTKEEALKSFTQRAYKKGITQDE